MAADILETAKEHYKTAKDGWQEIYRKSEEDLEFLSDEPFAQWDPTEANRRVTVGRPVIEVDQLSQFIHQVNNDIRMNTPSIHVIPSGDGSDTETAEIIQGRIKAIEYKSNADSAYDMGADFAVKSSLGFIRVDHDYIDDQSFNQELQIKRVINPAAILIDPNSIEPDGSDAKYGFVFEDITVKEFKEKWPKAAPVSFGEEKPSKAPQDTDKITIAEYFLIEESSEEKGLLDDGNTEPVTKGKKYKSTRTFKKTKVLRYKLSGQDELESTTFPGKYIPLVPVYGEEAWKKGKRNLNSLIRKSKSSARAYNALKSSETEILLKQQQAPVQAAVGQMRGFEDDWKHPEKAMVLYYHTTDVNGKDVPPPERLQPPTVSAGFANASLDAENNIRKTLGMYNAGVGKREGDSSGVALKQLEQSGDVASFHFGDNLVRSITHVGKILVCALPEIEDTSRIVNTIGKEDEHKLVGINGALAEGQERTYDFTKGSWDVRVTTGPSFTTQRQEAAQYYSEVIKAAPDLMPVIGDLVFKYQDAPGSQAISARLKKTIDPKLLDESERDEGEVDPQVAQLQQEMQQMMQAAEQQVSELQQELAKANAEKETAQLESKRKDLQAQDKNMSLHFDLETEKLKNTQLTIEKSLNEQVQQTQPVPPSPPAAPQQPMAIKLDTTGFQMMKTPEQLALEENEQQQEAQIDQAQLELQQQEMQMKAQQTDAVIQAIGGVSQQLNQLVHQVSMPITVIRDEAGNMIGAH